MLVKIIQSGSRWDIKAMGGYHYNQTVATAAGVVLQNARFGSQAITGQVVSTWGLEVAPQCVGTSTQRNLRALQTRPDPLGLEVGRDDRGFFIAKFSHLNHTPDVNLLVVVGDEITADQEAGFVPVQGE